MLDWLILPVLLALVVCLPAPPQLFAVVAVVTAMGVTTCFCAQTACAKSDVSARSAGDTAQIGRSGAPDDSCHDDCARHTGRAGGQAATVAGAVAIESDLRLARAVAAAGPNDLTVSDVL